MCFSNMYFGLQTGWISMMSLQSSLLGFALFKPFQSILQVKFSPVENVVLQTVAVATATMPLAAGFVGIIPALALLNKSDHPEGAIVLSFQQLVLWSLGVAFFGVFFAVPLRKQTIIREKLRFPSGTATAQMISLLHQQPDPTMTSTSSSTTIMTLRQRHKKHLQLNNDNDDDQQPLLSLTSDPSVHSSSSSSSYGSQGDLPNHLDSTNFEEAWHLKLKALLISFSMSSLYTLLSYFFPIITNLPIFNWLCFNLVDFRAWDWYFAPSLSYVGQGIIMGLPTTLSMLLGCIVGWGILSPMAYYSGWATGPVDDWKTGSKGWILWVSLGVMISESIISLAIVTIRTITRSIARSSLDTKATTETSTVQQEDDIETVFQEGEEEDDEYEDAPADQQVSKWTTIIGLIVSTLLCIYLVRHVFGPDILPVSLTLLAVVVAMFLSVLAVRALGETDLNPVSGIGKISQVIFAGILPGSIAANLIAGGIAEAGAQQAGDLMQDLKTGHLLHASPKAQFYGQLIGSLFSVFTASGAYLLYRNVYTIPGPEFPVPTAQVWLDMSRLVNGQPLPPHVSEFVIGFAIVFGIFVIIQETSTMHQRSIGWQRYIPQGMAFSIGMYNPPSFTLARVIGGLMTYYWYQYCEKHDDDDDDDTWWLDPRYRYKVGKVLIIIIGSGFVLGEGTFALVNMIMHACHVPHL
ncbi:OPT oligopeptide transporter protein-domain-containing protein [Halteromyces radiatus]|uniref:OPT oligopeptide transporter protein-domain-containing protein n=1 Tax=Halteromyces radiatus TaxID=101107 RepID=UPI0022206614|nr:OPT oligopeptide transporter protein-domain-containing protein [Halteromyces radiatus]KAI8093575.1 OPT oligopeptide transporter protein-domain-containing protein [Halteromyces radiatus]